MSTLPSLGPSTLLTMSLPPAAASCCQPACVPCGLVLSCFRPGSPRASIPTPWAPSVSRAGMVDGGFPHPGAGHPSGAKGAPRPGSPDRPWSLSHRGSQGGLCGQLTSGVCFRVFCPGLKFLLSLALASQGNPKALGRPTPVRSPLLSAGNRAVCSDWRALSRYGRPHPRTARRASPCRVGKLVPCDSTALQSLGPAAPHIDWEGFLHRSP